MSQKEKGREEVKKKQQGGVKDTIARKNMEQKLLRWTALTQSTI